jgi:hypothetical protein
MSNQFETKDPSYDPVEPDVTESLSNPAGQNIEDTLSQSSLEMKQIILEYAKLAALHNPSEQEADKLERILDLALDNELLSFWIVEIDHLLGHQLGLLDEEHREHYKDQESLLKEYLGLSENFPVPKDKQIANYCCTRNPELYINSIDGVTPCQ